MKARFDVVNWLKSKVVHFQQAIVWFFQIGSLNLVHRRTSPFYTEGKICILDIDVQGAELVKKSTLSKAVEVDTSG